MLDKQEMTMLLNEAADGLKAIYGSHIMGIILFGSYARQEADVASDIDLIVVGGSKFDPTDIFCIAEELHRTMGKAVDVYELREVNAGSAFYHTIMEEGVRIA